MSKTTEMTKTTKRVYETPKVELWLLPTPMNLLLNLSGEADFEDYEDAGEY